MKLFHSFRVQNNLLRDEAEHLDKKLKACQENVISLENQLVIVTEKDLMSAKELESVLKDVKVKNARFEIERKTHQAVSFTMIFER
jgi:hypothetical protein